MKPDQLSSEGAMRAWMIVELMRSTGETEFPAQLMSIFFWIAAHEGCKQQDLIDTCNISSSSVSRCVLWLGPRHRLHHRSGLRLVRRERDPYDYKCYRLFLTPKGKVFTNLLDNYSKAPLDSVGGSPVFTQAKEELQAYDLDESEDVG